MYQRTRIKEHRESTKSTRKRMWRGLGYRPRRIGRTVKERTLKLNKI